MKFNLTKLLDVNKNKYEGEYGKTSWIGNLSQNMTAENSPYSFELEKRTPNDPIRS